MRLPQLSLNARDQATVRSMIAFLEGRLEEKETIEWALSLGSDDMVKRWAVLNLLDRKEGVNLREPWRSAWRLIEEYWEALVPDFYGRLGIYNVQERLHSGEQSGALVSAIVDLVAPRLSIETYGKWELRFRKFPKRPKTFRDLFRVTMTSEQTLNPTLLELEKLADSGFLISLANALEAEAVRGLEMARRIGWRNVHLLLHRVYYVSESERDEVPGEIDEFSPVGFASSVKLLHTVVLRLFDVDSAAAQAFVCRWKQRTDSPIHLRLWAAVSRDARITSAGEVGDFLLHLDREVFWDLHHHPEITELRVRRFAEFDENTQREITGRIRGRPPRKLLRKNAEADRVKEYSLKWAVRELRRIEVAEATLPRLDKTWLESNVVRFPELAEMNRIDEGFLGPTPVEQESPTRESSLDFLAGIDRLKALEQAFSSPRHGWDDDPAERALDWLREGGNTVKVLKDLDSSPDGGAEFPNVWQHFCQEHSPSENQGKGTNVRDFTEEARRVLNLLAKMPSKAFPNVSEGISHWLCVWEKYVVAVPNWSVIWHRAWPLAVQTTNAMSISDQEPDTEVVEQPESDQSSYFYALNTSVGKLVGVFVAACPNLEKIPRPFKGTGDLGKIRNKIINAPGWSGLIAKQRMIQSLEYFLRADQQWAKKHLLEPLRADDTGVLALWRAISLRRRSKPVLKIIGNEMVDRTADHRLDRTTRRSLAFSLLVETLHAMLDKREPAVEPNPVQQMIRSLDDEVRAYCGKVITRFVRELSERSDQRPNPPLPEELFQSVAKPFLQKVWPQEHSLVSPAVSSGLAELPVAAGGDFAEAVSTIERFLVPFDCWSMFEYGFYSGEDSGKPKLSMIDDETNAQALLNLLDMTVGTAENAAIPYNLSGALEQVRKVAPHLAKTPKYRRLETAARRV